jgi:hypothetical protein
MQDDPEDWVKESSLMTFVYGGSYVNIAASGAGDGSIGCFVKRDGPRRFQIQGKRSRPFSFASRLFGIFSPKKTWAYNVYPGVFTESLTEAPLTKRGWTVQERFLPSRTIFFTGSEVFWECRQKFVSETFLTKSDLPERFWEFHYSNEGRNRKLSKGLWLKLMNSYSACDLTMARDKLVAISGLASVFHSELKEEYIAGMWREDLVSQLCWDILGGISKCDEYIAPSWSWASSSTEVIWESDLNLNAFRGLHVDDVKINLKTSDPFGQVSDGYLRISCLSFGLALVHLDNFSSRFYFYFTGREMIVPKIYSNTFFTLEKAGKSSFQYILPLCGGRSQGQILGLFLEPTGKGNGQYKRIGFFRIEGKGDCREFEIGLKENPLLGHKQREAQECIKVTTGDDGQKRCLIEIV